ncbi:hypothetical protein [Ralstonia pseudosolanacearum]|uniref:hypothetical protein n=1 Tax=Ralstonia pseudosolanacearum TaxID=1310165 RepID=UPI00048BF68B|nr:hypothetical protein [Ralstonia pseudosolanacearum]MDO3559582.1 hypothetical protein [Ralstonia pseudosolanacearum]MDO3579485.1 hypothetical protein [Ralstonia pseudosolanacearum]MDO3589407.1 hypothetical protein [Ralstonia pseudosolanacearum]
MSETSSDIYEDTKDLVMFSPERFLVANHGETFSFIGLTMLIRAHLARAGGRLHEDQLRRLLRIRGTWAESLFNDVLALRFVTDDRGYICRSITRKKDRAKAAQEAALAGDASQEAA